MVTVYPSAIDTNLNLPVAIDNVTATNASVINTLRGAIIAIENTLGVKPQGIYTTVRARLDYLEALFTSGGGGGGGSFTPGGDLSGTATTQIVIGLYTHPLAATMPVNSAVPVWDTNIYDIRQLTQDDILPGFTITGFNGGMIIECGTTITNPSFTASYSSTPASASISNTDNIDSPHTLISPFTSGTITGVFTHSVVNSSVTFTLNANKGVVNKSATQSFIYEARSFGGIGTAGATSATASGSNATLVGASGTLSNEGLHASDIGQTYGPFNPVGQKIYLLLPHSAVHGFKDQNGFTFVFNAPTTFSFTNQQSAVISMDLYESTNLLSTTFTITVVS